MNQGGVPLLTVNYNNLLAESLYSKSQQDHKCRTEMAEKYY